MKVVFLDIDGVLNKITDPRTFLPSCVEALNLITDTTGAVIVLHSTWRYAFTLEQMQEYLVNAGVTGSLIDMASVPDFEKLDSGILVFPEGTSPHKHERPGSIQMWLDHHPGEVESFVILDDDPNMEHLKEFHIQTSGAPGGSPLNEEDAARAIAMLGAIT